MSNRIFSPASLALILSLSVPAAADGLQINDLVIASRIPQAQRDATGTSKTI